MVCDRCISTVMQILEQYKIQYKSVALGKIILFNDLTVSQSRNILREFEKVGFNLIVNANEKLTNDIKSFLINIVNKELNDNFKLSVILTKEFKFNYSHLSRVFSKTYGNTIEQYYIKLRVEKSKELLSYKIDNISEIAYKLGYSSVSHFSRQFKSLTGVSPKNYKVEIVKRISLEDI